MTNPGPATPKPGPGPVSLPELVPQSAKFRQALRRRGLAAEGQVHLERRAPFCIEELKAQGGRGVHVTGLLDGEHAGQLSPADMHVERLRLNVEELAKRAEVAELADG